MDLHLLLFPNYSRLKEYDNNYFDHELSNNILLQLTESLGLSYKNAPELNKIVDTQLPPHRPRFQPQDVTIGGETVTMYSRDVIECIKALYGSAEFAPYMKYRPERHYGKDHGHERYYHDMHTGEWWWEMQVRIDILA